MDAKLKKLLLNWRLLLLTVFLIFSLVVIQPHIFGNDGASIRRVVPDSAAFLAGLQNPSPSSTPLEKEKILSFNGEKNKLCTGIL